MAAEILTRISIVHTKLQPPLLGPTVLHRPRLDEWLAKVQSHRVTLVVAAAGYGKTTMLAELAARDTALVWYTLSAADTDPLLFMAHLTEGVLAHFPEGFGDRQARGQANDSVQELQVALVNALSKRNTPITVVVEDLHAVNNDRQLVAVLDWLLQHAPRSVHFVLSSRLRPRLRSIPKLRASKQLLTLDEQVLRFTSDEVRALMMSRGVTLSEEEVQSLTDQTEGWVLGLQLAEQFLASGGGVADFRAQQGQREELFEYLAEEVLNKQAPQVRQFMTRSSVLRTLTAPALNRVLGENESAEWLRYLEERNLFLLRLGPDSFRYHHLVSDFLEKRLRQNESEWSALNRRAASFYEHCGQDEAAFAHWTAVPDFRAAGEVLLRMVPRAIMLGRLAAAAGWFGLLSAAVKRELPMLLLYNAQVAHRLGRIHTAFDLYSEAAELLEEAGERRGLVDALRGKATIYRDKGAHQKATDLYTAALQQLEPGDLTARAAILSLLGVNDAATGQLERAQDQLYLALDLYEEAGDVEGQLSVWNNIAQVLRVRQGRFEDALQASETAISLARELGSPLLVAEANSTRATILFLQGKYDAALQAATATHVAGTELRATNLVVDSLVTTGHVLRYGDQADRQVADNAYAEAFSTLANSDSQHYLGIEALLGSSALRRLRGDFRGAWSISRQAMEASQRRRHQWFSLVCKLEHATCTLALGEVGTGMSLLAECEQGFSEYDDTYHLAATYLCMASHESDAHCRATLLGRCLERVEQGQHYPLLARESESALQLLPAALGHPEQGATAEKALLHIGGSAVPVLLDSLGTSSTAVQRVIVRILGELGDERARKVLRGLASHKQLKADAEEALKLLVPRPEYQLRVRMLGAFELYRGDAKVGDREWRTARARALLQLLISNRGSYLPKDRVLEMLWPDLDEAAADNNFRFTLSSLNKLLEPHRGEGTSPYYVQRRGDSYGLDPQADIWIDTEEFESLIRHARSAQRGSPSEKLQARAYYQQALDLYLDDYLPEQVYEDWTSGERERLRELYFHAAGSLAELLLHDGRYDEVIQIARAVLRKDPCREDAYRLLMRAHLQRGDRTAALRAYQGCVAALERELGVAPLPETRQLYEQARSAVR